jgi:hypothetical protein
MPRTAATCGCKAAAAAAAAAFLCCLVLGCNKSSGLRPARSEISPGQKHAAQMYLFEMVQNHSSSQLVQQAWTSKHCTQHIATALLSVLSQALTQTFLHIASSFSGAACCKLNTGPTGPVVHRPPSSIASGPAQVSFYEGFNAQYRAAPFTAGGGTTALPNLPSQASHCALPPATRRPWQGNHWGGPSTVGGARQHNSNICTKTAGGTNGNLLHKPKGDGGI